MPVGGVVAVYAVRNYLLHGGLGFRFSALDWLAKENYLAYFAFHETAPTISEMWSRLGFSGVAPLILRQFDLLVWVALNNALLLIGGPLALVWLVWRRSPFALLGLLYGAAIVLIVCVAYHLEQRYLFALYPIFCVALGAAASSLYQRIHRALRASWVRPVQGALVTILVLLFLVESRKVVLQVRGLGRAATGKGACDDAVAFIRRSVAFDAPILTSSPWFIAWATERPAVNAPTNGEEAVVRVANHYRTDWAIDGLPSYATADVEALLKGLERPGTPIRPELAYHGTVCNVYRLHRAP